ncbi:glycosyltransferase family 4 protein [Bacteroidota bacterium]
MNILMVLENEFPPDDRVEKEAKALLEANHKITIACSDVYEKRPKTEEYKEIRIKRNNISAFTYKKLSALCLILPFYFTKWKRFLDSILKNENYDAIHIHDLPLSKTGYKLARKYNLKLICDEHEYYSNWIVHTAHYNTAFGKIAKRLSNWGKYERYYLSKADHVITIEEPLRQCYIKEVGLPTNKIITVPNTPSIKVFNPDNIKQEIVDKYKPDFVLFYAGNIDILRGIDIVIKALPELTQKIPSIKFLMAGKFRKNCNPVEDAKKLGVSKHVEFLGWVPVELLPSYIKASDICVHIPRVYREEQNNSVATKVYQYIIMCKPVIIGQAKMMKAIIEDNKLGYSIKDGDIQDFVEKVLKIYNNPQIAGEFSQNCNKIKDQYIWEKTVKNLLAIYDN